MFFDEVSFKYAVFRDDVEKVVKKIPWLRRKTTGGCRTSPTRKHVAPQLVRHSINRGR